MTIILALEIPGEGTPYAGRTQCLVGDIRRFNRFYTCLADDEAAELSSTLKRAMHLLGGGA